ncbi:TIGR03943 family protein [Actinosynnema sp. NPDC020468]|uniref:TIGR03943 family putative permease subunit n=1 Tax=Actinosynnema sp. NPDC020468 TaxID=3154488 RepID=UPI0033E9296E
MRRETQNILLVLLGGALLKLALTGTYLRYVKASLQPWLVATGAIMVLLALVAIARDVRGKTAGHEGHEHTGRSPWLLLLPVLAVFLISPPALGADTVNRSDRTIAQQNSASGFAALPDEQVVSLTMTDFVTRTAWDDSGSLDHRTVKLTGFVVQKDGNTFVARLAISCCAADASPIKVRLLGGDLAALADDQWVEVTGRVVPGSATKDTAYTPSFTVSAVTPVATPEDTYES